jgi:hypothetical protein
MFKSSRSEIREAVVGPKINRQAKAKPFATETDPALGSDIICKDKKKSENYRSANRKFGVNLVGAYEHGRPAHKYQGYVYEEFFAYI